MESVWKDCERKQSPYLCKLVGKYFLSLKSPKKITKQRGKTFFDLIYKNIQPC